MKSNLWKEKIIELILIFSQIQENEEALPDEVQLKIQEYEQSQISAAFAYVFENSAHKLLNQHASEESKKSAVRIFHASETEHLSKQTLPLLREISRLQLLPEVRFEYFLDRVLTESRRNITPSLIKRYLYDHLFFDPTDSNQSLLLKGKERIN